MRVPRILQNRKLASFSNINFKGHLVSFGVSHAVQSKLAFLFQRLWEQLAFQKPVQCGLPVESSTTVTPSILVQLSTP